MYFELSFILLVALFLEKFTTLVKILHCRRQWRHWQISPLGHPVLVVQARPWLLCCGVFYYGAFIPSKNMVWSRNDILWLLVFGIFVKILIPCFYAFEHFPDMRCFRGFDAGLKLELGLDGCFTSSCSPWYTDAFSRVQLFAAAHQFEARESPLLITGMHSNSDKLETWVL